MWCNLVVRALFILALCVCVCGAQPRAHKSRRPPRFEDFKVQVRFNGTPAKPRFTAPAELPPSYQPSENDLLPDSDDRYRGSVTLAAQQGPNFAGHYTI